MDREPGGDERDEFDVELGKVLSQQVHERGGRMRLLGDVPGAGEQAPGRNAMSLGKPIALQRHQLDVGALLGRGDSALHRAE